MSYAPESILKVRKLIQKYVPLTNVELGIVGDDSHAASGSSYHLGKDALRNGSYSVVESSRDRLGLSNAASALDIGYFSINTPNGKQTLRTFSRWLVEECKRGAGDTLDIREVIYSLDGKTVKRWDREKERSTGDDSHRSHTHISWYRNSENYSKTALFTRWFEHIGLIKKEEIELTPEDRKWIAAQIDAAVAKNAKAVWDSPLIHPADKKPIKAGDYLRYNDHSNERFADKVIKALTELFTKKV